MTKIVTTIDCDEKHCWNCRHRGFGLITLDGLTDWSVNAYCTLFSRNLKGDYDIDSFGSPLDSERCVECLGAELVEMSEVKND
jgi:hypothetical protein